MSPEVYFSAIVTTIGTIITAVATIYASRKSKEADVELERAKAETLKAQAEIEKAKESIKKSKNMFGSREHVESASPLDDRVAVGLGIKEIRIANYTSNVWLNTELVDAIGLSSRSALVQRMQELVEKENIRLTMVITAPGSQASKEAISSEKVININTTIEDREKLFYCAYYAIRQNIQPGGYLHNSFKEGDFKYRLTDISLPYGIFQVIYEDKSKNHIKLDLYSPYIAREKERRSIFIYEEQNPEDYNYFSKDFDNIFKNTISPTEEKKMEDEWLQIAEKYYN